MTRTLLLGLLLLLAVGCRLPPEPVPVRPLPEDAPPLPYSDLLSRARSQASLATEAFYIDSWPDVEYAARGLEQTARFLKKANDIPPAQKERLEGETGVLAKEAGQLREAALAKDVRLANTSLQKILLSIRTLRPEP